MQSTTKDLRYLEAKEKFIEYAFLAVGDHFDSRENFESYFQSINGDDQKSLFLRTASLYLFLVKRGDWVVDVPGSDKIVDYLTNTYKYVGIFSLIESLSSEKFIDFYQFIIRKKSMILFPIADREALDHHYENYKADYGSIKKCISFFKALSPERQDALTSRLDVKGIEPSIENLETSRNFYTNYGQNSFMRQNLSTTWLVVHPSALKAISLLPANYLSATLFLSLRRD